MSSSPNAARMPFVRSRCAAVTAGEGYHAVWLPVQQLHLLEVDADHWKTWVHQRLATPLGSPGAMTLFQAVETP